MIPFLYFIELAETPKVIWSESEEKAIEELLKKFEPRGMIAKSLMKLSLFTFRGAMVL
jgi:hypothetical protein